MSNRESILLLGLCMHLSVLTVAMVLAPTFQKVPTGLNRGGTDRVGRSDGKRI